MEAGRTTTELSAISETSFEDAIQQGVARATSTLRGVEGIWIKDMNVMIEHGNIIGYKVNMEVTFFLEDEREPSERRRGLVVDPKEIGGSVMLPIPQRPAQDAVEFMARFMDKYNEAFRNLAQR